MQVRTFTPILKTLKSKVRATNLKSDATKIKSWVKNTKRERAKSKVVKEIKAVFEVGKKFVRNDKPYFSREDERDAVIF